MGEERKKKSWFSLTLCLLNCSPKPNVKAVHFFSTCICHRLGFLICKGCLVEAIMVHRLVAMVYFLEKEEIQMKETGDSEVSSKVQTKMAGRKEDLLSSEEKSLFYVVWKTEFHCYMSRRLPSGWNWQNCLHVVLSALQLLAFLKNWASFWGFVHFIVVYTTSFLSRMEKNNKKRKGKTPVLLDYI